LSPRLKRLSGRPGADYHRHVWLSHPLPEGCSHVKLRRIGESGEKQTLTIPLHTELDPGTIRAIMRQAARYIPESELEPHFYSE
jgi:hypothetical protein